MLFDKDYNYISPNILAKMISSHSKYKQGMVVRLMACNTGLSPGRGMDSYAQRLANKMGAGVVVEGPDSFVWYSPNGRAIIAPPNTGETWDNFTKKAANSGPNRNKEGVYSKFECECGSK